MSSKWVKQKTIFCGLSLGHTPRVLMSCDIWGSLASSRCTGAERLLSSPPAWLQRTSLAPLNLHPPGHLRLLSVSLIIRVSDRRSDGRNPRITAVRGGHGDRSGGAELLDAVASTPLRFDHRRAGGGGGGRDREIPGGAPESRGSVGPVLEKRSPTVASGVPGTRVLGHVLVALPYDCSIRAWHIRLLLLYSVGSLFHLIFS